MFVEERRKNIIKLLEQQTRITVSELTETLKVSEATVRRDLQELETQGVLKRTHGGAMLDSPSGFEASFDEKEITALEEKKEIAKAAASFIKEGDTIILDAGTTTMQMIPFIMQKKITVITNSLVAANALSSSPEVQLFVAGGYNRFKTKALIGRETQQFFSMYYADKLFLGANGVDISHGITTPTVEEAPIKHQMVKSAKEVFVLADHSKFNQVSLSKIASIDEIDCIITDSKIEKQTLDSFQTRGIDVLCDK